MVGGGDGRFVREQAAIGYLMSAYAYLQRSRT